MSKIKILVSIIVGLVLTAEIMPASAAVTSDQDSTVSISNTTMASRVGRRRHRGSSSQPSFSRGRGGIPGIFAPANPPAGGGARCSRGRGGGVCR